MRPLRLLILSAVLLCACHLEDRTPAGSRNDEAEIRQVVRQAYADWEQGHWGALSRLYERPPADSTAAGPWRRQAGLAVRVLRTDVHQAGNLADVWVAARVSSPAGDRDEIHLMALAREPGTPPDWRVLLWRPTAPAP